MLNNEFPPLGGGTGTVNQYMLEYFSKIDNVSIDLLTSSQDGVPAQEQYSDHIRIFKVPVVNHCIHHSSNRELLAYVKGALLKSRELCRENKYDFSFAWCSVPAGYLAYLLYKFNKLPYFVRVSGPDIPGFEKRYKYLYPFLKPFLKATWNSAISTIAKCEEEVELLHRTSQTTNVKIIPNGVNLQRFKPNALNEPRRGPLRCLCVGRLIYRKGQDQLIEAVAGLVERGVEVELKLVGTGSEEKAFVELAREKGVSQNIVFEGYVDREGIPGMYRAADVFLLPSFNEGMSVALLEALASGLPIIATRVGGADRIVRHGVEGFIYEFGEVDKIVEFLEECHGDRKKLMEMSLSARKRAEGFGWDRVFKEYQELFEI